MSLCLIVSLSQKKTARQSEVGHHKDGPHGRLVSLSQCLKKMSQMRRYHEKLKFLSEGVRLGLDKEIRLDGTYLAYFPFSRMIERSRVTPYHKKLLLAEVYLNWHSREIPLLA